MASDPTGVCVFCGTERPSSVERCPSCGRGWIDERVTDGKEPGPEASRTSGRALGDVITTGATDTTSTGSARVVEGGDTPTRPPPAGDAAPRAEQGGRLAPASSDPAVDSDAAEQAVGGDDPTAIMEPPRGPAPVSPTAETQLSSAPVGAGPDGEGTVSPAGGGSGPAPPPPMRWWIPVGIALVVLAVYAVIFSVLLSRTGEDVAATVVTTTTGTPTTPDSTTTTAPTGTTTSTSTTTTTTTTTLAPIPPSGTAVALGDLRLGASQLGPLLFGQAGNAAGVLVSTFGQPDTYFAIGEESGLCPTETGRAILWGPLTAIFRDEDGTEVLVGYEVDGTLASVRAHPAEQLRTLSGIGLGDSTTDIDNAYGRVSYEPIDGSDAFLVLSNEDGRTLVWGFLSDADPAEVLSISSPRPCDGGPFATG